MGFFVRKPVYKKAGAGISPYILKLRSSQSWILENKSQTMCQVVCEMVIPFLSRASAMATQVPLSPVVSKFSKLTAHAAPLARLHYIDWT
jgi:hypothetical protein